jgi:TolA-binding protein
MTAFSTLVTELSDTPLAGFAQYHLGFAYLEKDNTEEAAKAFSAAANTSGADEALRMESRFRAAELYDKLGWTAAALGAYEQLRNDFPDSDYANRADYGYGWALYHSGRYDEAYTLADEFINRHPDSPHVAGFFYMKGSCRYQQARYAEALELYAALREKYSGTPFAGKALYKSAWAHHLGGDNLAARETAIAFLESCPDSEFRGEGLYLLGTLRVLDGDYEEGLEQFRQVSEKYPKSEFAAEALFKCGECYAQLDMRDEAAKTFETFAKNFPGNPLTEQAMLRSGDARFTAQDFAEALANYKAILEKPGDPAIEEETLYRLAVTYHNMKQQGESAAAFNQLLSKYPEGKYAAEAHFRIGDFELRQNKDSLKAIEAYQAALTKKPSTSVALGALQGLATARYEQKDYEQASAQVLQIIHDYPDSSLPDEAYLWCGQWLNEVERWTDAAGVFSALLKAYPEHEQRPEILFALGNCHEKAGDDAAAIKSFTAALDLDKEGARAAELRYRLGNLYENGKELDKAKTFYESAANLDGGEISARARFQLAALYETQGDFDNAARNFMRLAILYVHETLSPEALWRAGNCYVRLNNAEQAKSIFEELVADYPDSSFAQEARNALAQTSAVPEKTE